MKFINKLTAGLLKTKPLTITRQMPITGADFEQLVKPFFKKLFEEMCFIVIEVRKQDSGNQNGFDISVVFFDDNDVERHIFFECKYYTAANLYWSDIFNKEIQLESSNYNPTAFIALSPLRNLSNIDHNVQAKAINKFKFPVDFWTPDKNIEQIFALDKELYKKVFDCNECTLKIDRDKEIQRIKAILKNLIQRKEAIQYSNWITIKETNQVPDEEPKLKTTLDEKLNSVFNENDERRIEYHKLRANYKVFLDGLEDLSPELRTNILSWESDLRIKAKRLSDKFNIDHSYTPQDFYYEFFEIAGQEILTFYKDYELKGDKEKLLNGVVFELAAQCPLDWRKNGST